MEQVRNEVMQQETEELLEKLEVAKKLLEEESWPNPVSTEAMTTLVLAACIQELTKEVRNHRQ